MGQPIAIATAVAVPVISEAGITATSATNLDVAIATPGVAVAAPGVAIVTPLGTPTIVVGNPAMGFELHTSTAVIYTPMPRIP